MAGISTLLKVSMGNKKIISHGKTAWSNCFSLISVLFCLPRSGESRTHNHLLSGGGKMCVFIFDFFSQRIHELRHNNNFCWIIKIPEVIVTNNNVVLRPFSRNLMAQECKNAFSKIN